MTWTGPDTIGSLTFFTFSEGPFRVTVGRTKDTPWVASLEVRIGPADNTLANNLHTVLHSPTTKVKPGVTGALDALSQLWYAWTLRVPADNGPVPPDLVPEVGPMLSVAADAWRLKLPKWESAGGRDYVYVDGSFEVSLSMVRKPQMGYKARIRVKEGTFPAAVALKGEGWAPFAGTTSPLQAASKAVLALHIEWAMVGDEQSNSDALIFKKVDSVLEDAFAAWGGEWHNDNPIHFGKEARKLWVRLPLELGQTDFHELCEIAAEYLGCGYGDLVILPAEDHFPGGNSPAICIAQKGR